MSQRKCINVLDKPSGQVILFGVQVNENDMFQILGFPEAESVENCIVWFMDVGQGPINLENPTCPTLYAESWAVSGCVAGDPCDHSYDTCIRCKSKY